MKKIFQAILVSFILLLLSPCMAHAAANPSYMSTAVEENGYYIETIITDATPNNQTIFMYAASNSTTKTKTTYIKDANGNILWYVSITATFTYDGNTSQCTSCSHNAISIASSWEIKSSSSSKSGNSATATATATHKGILGISQDYTESVTIECSPSGVVS